MNAETMAHPASFRDPESYVVLHRGTVYRVITTKYQPAYQRLMDSGLYDDLVKAKLLLDHEVVKNSAVTQHFPDVALVLKPKQLTMISYPYEWAFSQLRDAALTTLEIQRRALERGLVLKDASSFNIQFVEGQPMLIDLGSFEKYEEDKPWVAYWQFCQHFLAPLALTVYRGAEMLKLSRIHLDGVPLDLTVRLLPLKSKLNRRIFIHLVLHAKSQARHRATANRRSVRLPKEQLQAIVSDLAAAIKQLQWRTPASEWGDYYRHTNYSEAAFQNKQQIVRDLLSQCRPKLTWDLGANDGRFSELAAVHGEVVAFDIDPVAVETNYRHLRAQQDKPAMLPLVMDLTNPSPSLGWMHHERLSLIERGPADLAIALALVHHLAISGNVPLERIAELMAACGRMLIIEFVPKEDSMVKRLLASREDIFTQYDQSNFEAVFARHFKILKKIKVENSERTIYYMRRLT